MNRLSRLLLVSLALPSLGLAQAVSFDISSFTQRLNALEQRLNDQSRTLQARPAVANTYGAPEGSALADLAQRLGDVENEASQQTGDVERLSNAVTQLARKLDALAKDMDLRLQQLEDATPPAAGNAEQGTPIAASVPATAPAIPTSLSATELYNRAYAFLTAGNYPGAQQWLSTFIERFPKDALADNAYYWLGEVHLVQNQPKEAVVAFRNGLQAFPQGNKAPANLFKMGIALQQLQQPALAKAAWSKLVKDYPQNPEANKAQQKLKELKV